MEASVCSFSLLGMMMMQSVAKYHTRFLHQHLPRVVASVIGLGFKNEG